jgi:hypothetical protein
MEVLGVGTKEPWAGLISLHLCTLMHNSNEYDNDKFELVMKLYLPR